MWVLENEVGGEKSGGEGHERSDGPVQWLRGSAAEEEGLTLECGERGRVLGVPKKAMDRKRAEALEGARLQCSSKTSLRVVF